MNVEVVYLFVKLNAQIDIFEYGTLRVEFEISYVAETILVVKK